jgi:hypothetical protein
MSDFIQKANVKRSVRTITTKIADVAALNTLVQDVIDTNTFQCVIERRRLNKIQRKGPMASAMCPGA